MSDAAGSSDEMQTVVLPETEKKGHSRRHRRPRKTAKAQVQKGSTPRASRPFPAAPFEESLAFAREMFVVGSGQPVRRLTLFDHLKKAPESGASRMLIVNSNRYGLTKGSYAAEQLELTEDGRKAVDESASKREQANARVKLAILQVPSFRQLYERFINARLPAKAVLTDALEEFGVPQQFAEEGVDTFIVNLRFVGLLQTLSGADRIISIDHLLDSLPAAAGAPTSAPVLDGNRSIITSEAAAFETTCFYITPIGDEGSEPRRHSDLFLGSIIEPALSNFGLKVVRADNIGEPGIITRQVIEHLLRCRLVIADLSFHNPNVFYELALRHAVRLPIVQIIRAGDRIPFDIHQMRTVVIDNRDIYSLVPKLETYRSEIATQVRSALDAKAEVDTPLSVYFPNFRANNAWTPSSMERRGPRAASISHSGPRGSAASSAARQNFSRGNGAVDYFIHHPARGAEGTQPPTMARPNLCISPHSSRLGRHDLRRPGVPEILH
jgi:hypothetical protein